MNCLPIHMKGRALFSLNKRVKWVFQNAICSSMNDALRVFFVDLLYEPCHKKAPHRVVTYLMTCAPREYSDQPAHPCSRISLRWRSIISHKFKTFMIDETAWMNRLISVMGAHGIMYIISH